MTVSLFMRGRIGQAFSGFRASVVESRGGAVTVWACLFPDLSAPMPASGLRGCLAAAVAHPHADCGKVGKETVDSPRQVALDLVLEIAVSLRCVANLEVSGQEFVFRTERPHMDAQARRMRVGDALGGGQRLGDPDCVGILGDAVQVSQLVFEQLHQRQTGHVAQLSQVVGIEGLDEYGRSFASVVVGSRAVSTARSWGRPMAAKCAGCLVSG